MSDRIPKILIDKIANNEVIPFVGAGVSSGVKNIEGNVLFLGWNDLLLSSIKILNDNNKNDEAEFIRMSVKLAKTAEDYLTIANKIKEYLASQWQDYLEDNFKKTFDESIDRTTLAIPKEIWNLSRLVITTNYDNVMRWANDDKDNLTTWNINSIAGQVKSLKKYPEEDTLWHLHGGINDLDDIVLTKDSYEKVYGDDSEVKGAIEVLKAHMLTKSFIFLGFSLDDIYLREQLKKVQNLFGEYSSPHFILLKKGNESDLSEFGDITPIYIENYEDDYLAVLKMLTDNKKEEILVETDEKNNQSLEVFKELDDTKYFTVPFKSKENGAIGIEDKLKEVHEVLSSDSKTNIGQLASFQGMGGLGKTQLAVEYAYRYKNLYNGVIWLTIDHDIDEQLLELAQKYSWVNKDIEAKTKLEITKKILFGLKNTLFIFDNVDSRDEIKELYEKLSDNKILITSRNAIQGFKSIPLDTLNQENSLKLLASESNREIAEEELEYAVKIFIELDGLPLALEMAGSYVEYLGLSWKDYFELYKEKGISFLEESNIQSYTKHEVNISKTLSLSDTLLEKEPLLESIIYLLAWGASESIDKYLISILLEEKEINLIQSIKMGVKLKFLKESDDGFTLHRLVKDIYRTKKPLDISFATKISQNLSNYMKEIKDDFLKLRELDKASFQAKSWAKEIEDKYLKASLINYSVYPDYHRGKYKIALENIDSVFELFEDNTDSEIYAEILNNEGYLISALGDKKKAEFYYKEALNMRERLYLNTDHLDVIKSLNNMGSILNEAASHKEAESYFKKALEMGERLYPNTDHPDIASSLRGIGSVLNSLESTNEAKLYYKKSIDMRERLYPNIDHPYIVNSLNSMGYILRLSEKEEAKSYYKKALDMSERLYPDTDHAEVATSLDGMGNIFKTLGKKEKAKFYCKKALNMRERLYKNNNNSVIANSLNNMGVILGSNESAYYFEKAYKMNESIHGKNHKFTVVCMLNYIRYICSNTITKAKGILILKEFQKELKGNKDLLIMVNSKLKEVDTIGRKKSKRKKGRG